MFNIRKIIELVGAVMGTTLWFVVIWGAAVFLGWVIDYTALTMPWVPHFMIGVAHVVEYFMFGMDIIGLVWSVGIHLYHHVRGK